MSIIEREIEKRQAIIDSKEAKINELAELRVKAETLEAEIASIDTNVLVAEIEELKSYLPKPEEPEVEEPEVLA
jgi:hypothetical protein